MLLPLLPMLVSEPRLIYPTRPHIIRPTAREIEQVEPLLAVLPGIGGIPGFSGAAAAAAASSFLFDGTTSRIEKSSSVIAAYPFTVVAWIKPDAGLASTASFAVGGVGADTSRLSLVDNNAAAGGNTIDAFSTNGAGTTQLGTGPTNWTAGTWAHVAGVWGSTNAKRTAYFNGTAGTTNTNANTTDPSIYTRTILGARYNAGAISARFKGKMAYMAMWNLELSGADITSLNGGALPTAVQAANLVFYPVWSGGVVVDQISGLTLTSTGVSSDAELPF